MAKEIVFYLCPKCFKVSVHSNKCHDHAMIYCDTAELSEEQRKPLIDESGQLITRAPRWFLEAIGVIDGEQTLD